MGDITREQLAGYLEDSLSDTESAHVEQLHPAILAGARTPTHVVWEHIPPGAVDWMVRFEYDRTGTLRAFPV